LTLDLPPRGLIFKSVAACIGKNRIAIDVDFTQIPDCKTRMGRRMFLEYARDDLRAVELDIFYPKANARDFGVADDSIKWEFAIPAPPSGAEMTATSEVHDF